VVLVGVRNVFKKFTTPVEEQDRERRRLECTAAGAVPTNEVQRRSLARVAGEVSSVRIVPRAGAPSLEVIIDDGHGRATAIFLGRKHLAGLSPGRRVVFEGRVQVEASRVVMVNPVYEFTG
jgi:RecG-like helicase